MSPYSCLSKFQRIPVYPTADLTPTVQSAHITEWNPGLLHNDAPNPYVKVYLDSVQVHRTHTVNRELAPRWDYLLTLCVTSYYHPARIHRDWKDQHTTTNPSSL
jgi:hypothetical protein